MTSDKTGNGKDAAEEELFMFLNNSAQSGDTVSIARPSSTGSLHSRRTPESQSTDVAQGDDVAGNYLLVILCEVTWKITP